jgi:DNA modification methylase
LIHLWVSGTIAFAAKKLQRNYTGLEINPEYHEIISDRLEGKLNEVRRVKNKSYVEEKAALTKTFFD